MREKRETEKKIHGSRKLPPKMSRQTVIDGQGSKGKGIRQRTFTASKEKRRQT